MPAARSSIAQLKRYLSDRILGQEHLIERVLIALLCDGHLLVEGAPGLAKTRMVKMLSEAIECEFKRIQFTPDLLPSDLTGTDIFRPEQGIFEFRKGPLFHNIILADEINRSPAKVQSALLEAMAERQITVGSETYPLPSLFLVMATQNPIEHEGTYPLPEAQLDRFFMQVNIRYPDAMTELKILKLCRREASQQESSPKVSVLTVADILNARREILNVHMAEQLENYLIELIMTTRQPERHDLSLQPLIRYGASPRGTLALDAASRARAWLNDRDYVTPMDIQAVFHDVLRHRILISYEAEAQGRSSDDLLTAILDIVPVP